MSNIIVTDKIEMRKINEIKPYVRNPRKNDRTVNELVKFIPIVGFNVPIVVDEQGVIVKGHARFAAAIKLGMEEVPCVVSHADPEAIKADRIADNKISELSEWMNEELEHEIDMLDIDVDLSGLGFPKVDFESIPVPKMEDFKQETRITDEERQKLYMEFLEQQEKENARNTQITTERAIERAEERQREIGAHKPRYYKIICEKCGHVMFVREGDAMEAE